MLFPETVLPRAGDKLMASGACGNAASGSVVWERKCSHENTILAFGRDCGNTQLLLGDLSEHTCLFTMMDDGLRTEPNRFLFWRWHENPAWNFCYSLLPEPVTERQSSCLLEGCAR